MINPNDFEKEAQDLGVMLEFFNNNIGDLPVLDQLAFLQANVEFTEKLKPIYLRTLMRDGGQ